MKRLMSACLALALALTLAVPAWAAGPVAGPQPAYVNAWGQVMDSQGHILFQGPADQLVYYDQSLLIYQADDALVVRRSDGSRRSLGLLACDAVWSRSDNCVYYVRTSAPDTLAKLSLTTLTASIACQAAGPIQYLRVGINGLLAEVDGAEYLYIPAIKRLVGPDVSVSGQQLFSGERYEARLDGEGRLTVLQKGDSQPVEIALNVMCAALDGDTVYYLQAWGENARLMAYQIPQGLSTRLYRFDQPMWDQIAVVGGQVFVVSRAGGLYQYDLAQQRIELSDALGASFQPLIASSSAMAVLYDLSGGSYDAYPLGTAQAAPTPTPTPTPSPTPVPTPTPNPYPTLSMGARGEAVRRLQERLKELGYLAGSADGIYGQATQTAVLYLQFDMGYSQTGTASAQFQKEVLYGDPPTYSTYVTLVRGDSGIRVRDLQQRLWDLCYIKEPVDGYYGSGTAAAVERFQTQEGYKVNGGQIGPSQLRTLFKSSAEKCQQYYTLSQGDQAPVVKQLNQRLKKLGYLTGTDRKSVV